MNKTERIIKDIFLAMLFALMGILVLTLAIFVVIYLFEEFLNPALITIVVLLFIAAVYLIYKDIHQ